MILAPTISLFLAAALVAAQEKEPEPEPPASSSYGVDVSFPIFHSVSDNYPWLKHNQYEKAKAPKRFEQMPLQPLGNRHELYQRHLEGCRAAYPDQAQWCDYHEYHRLTMNLRQPQSMQNYTKQGFQKIKAPETLTNLIGKFWKQNHYKGQEEQWPQANTYCNHWDSPTYLISVDNTGLRGSGYELKKQIWEAAAATLEEWTEQELQPCSLYGIRVYQRDAIMLPHVDRLPLVASAIIPVAQDLEEPWPLEVYDHDGKAHNITMEPGEMFLFESHSVIHGHPFPLKGEFAAYVFIHFEPTGTSLHQDSTGIYRKGTSIDEHYRQSVQKGVGGPSAVDDWHLPPYIRRESPEEANWREENPDGWVPPEKVLQSTAHLAAKSGNLQQLLQELEKDEQERANNDDDQSILTQRDESGWQILHQGVASGNKEVVKALIERGASINTRTHGGYGQTPLRIAEKYHGSGHPIVAYLKSLGALSLGPEL